MMKRSVVLASLPLLASIAHADEVKTETADTLVVVTPNAPVVLTQQPPGATEAPPTMPPVAPAVAQPVAQPAPQNEDWNNVSHINGQLVKVGEKHEYLIRFKKSNISANPFGPFWGYYDAAYSYGINQNLAITASISGYSKSDSYDASYSHTMLQVTASMPIYLRRTFDGPFMEPGLIYRTSSTGSSDSMDTQSWVGPELLFGWHWNFDSGLNISWAVGPAKHMSDNNTNSQGYYDTSSDKVDFNGYFRFGYNF